MSLAVGDVVRLKTGSPNMTVTGIDDNGWATCVWFTESPAYQYQAGYGGWSGPFETRIVAAALEKVVSE